MLGNRVGLAAAVAAGVLWGGAGAAQENLPDWSVESEVAASVFFGASDQTTVASKLGLARKGVMFELDNAFSYLYGEASGADGEAFVNKRSWNVESNVAYRRFTAVNPYVFASALSSLEKKIDLRLKGGAGAKVTAIDNETTKLDFGAAVLAEQTFQDTPDNGEEELLARWTGEFSFRKTFSEQRLVLQAKANYNPVFDQFDNYTIKAESSLGFALSRVVRLRLSVEDNYDSRAKARGAADNNDGRVLFGVLASFE